MARSRVAAYRVIRGSDRIAGTVSHAANSTLSSALSQLEQQVASGGMGKLVCPWSSVHRHGQALACPCHPANHPRRRASKSLAANAVKDRNTGAAFSSAYRLPSLRGVNPHPAPGVRHCPDGLPATILPEDEVAGLARGRSPRTQPGGTVHPPLRVDPALRFAV